MTANKDGTITICGVSLDNPLDGIELYKRGYSVRKEGTRTTIQSVWLNRYAKDGSAIVCEGYCLEMTNRGVVTLDGQQVRDGTAVANAKEIFSELSKP